MPGRDIAALLQAEPTARALGAATGPAHQTDRREWLGQLIAAGDTVLSEGRAALWLHDAGSGRLRLAFPRPLERRRPADRTRASRLLRSR